MTDTTDRRERTTGATDEQIAAAAERAWWPDGTEDRVKREIMEGYAADIVPPGYRIVRADADLRERIAKAALDSAEYDSGGEWWCANEDTYDCEGPVEWHEANDSWRQNGYRIADAVLAALLEATYD